MTNCGGVRFNSNSTAPQSYLRSLLTALKISLESQMLVFSKTSIQQARIKTGNPRSLFFNDSVAVGWVRTFPKDMKILGKVNPGEGQGEPCPLLFYWRAMLQGECRLRIPSQTF